MRAPFVNFRKFRAAHLFFLAIVILTPLLFGGDASEYMGRIDFQSFVKTNDIPTSFDVSSVLGFESDDLKKGELSGNPIALKVMTTDLNADGVKEKLFYVSPHGCGSMGCTMAIEDGKTKRFLGSVFGYEFYVSKESINGYYVLHAPTSHFTSCYVFDGKEYKMVFSTVGNVPNQFPEEVPLITR